MDRMRIAQIAPLAEAVPPKGYGGTERVVSYLTEELVSLGHDVTLFASGDSATRARLVPMWPRATRLDPEIRDPLAPGFHILERVRERAREFDVLHFHLDYLSVGMFAAQRPPFLSTMHGRLDLPESRPVYEAYPHLPLVSISDAQRRPLPGANWWRPSTTACPSGCSRRGRCGPPTWPSSGGSRRRSAWTARSRSPAGPACR
jgi:glycosyltransferase involved in cell wall biosynthesis